MWKLVLQNTQLRMSTMQRTQKNTKKTKMIITIDTETKGLDATKYVTGCIIFEHKKPEIYRNKKELWLLSFLFF